MAPAKQCLLNALNLSFGIISLLLENKLLIHAYLGQKFQNSLGNIGFSSVRTRLESPFVFIRVFQFLTPINV